MTDPKFLEANAAKLAKMAMDTDWHAEAQMYAECLGRVKDWCNQRHETWVWDSYGRHQVPCQCLECGTKQRVQRIISDNLK
jgi:hypothetical protein